MAHQGFCIRLKAVLPVATPSGSQSLLVNAVRGKPAEFQLAARTRFPVGLASLVHLKYIGRCLSSTYEAIRWLRHLYFRVLVCYCRWGPLLLANSAWASGKHKTSLPSQPHCPGSLTSPHAEMGSGPSWSKLGQQDFKRAA